MINFTAIVVVYNEDRHLDECLKSLQFCQEKIVIDLGSSDNSIGIAEQNYFRVIKHDRVDIVEQIKAWAINQAKNDWIVFVDPDEIFPVESLSEIIKFINKKYTNRVSLSKLKDASRSLFTRGYKWTKVIGGFSFPYLNYFIGNPIKYGRWQATLGNIRVFNKNSIIISDLVHQGMRRRDGFENIKMKNIIKHYWIDSMDQFYEKHNRYLKYEGKSRYEKGVRYSFFKMRKSLFYFFISNYVIKLGFLDKKNGTMFIKLALWYEKEAWLSLKKYQDNLNNQSV